MTNHPLYSLGRRLQRAGAGLAAAYVLGFAGQAAAKVDGVTSVTGNFTLVAKADFISAADGSSVYTWGYALGTGTDCAAQPTGLQMQYPGPTLIVNQGQVVTITLCNQLPANVSVLFPGQMEVLATGGVTGKITPEARPYLPPASPTNPVLAQNKVTYTFVAMKPGTFSYHSAAQMNVQIEMGLVGALIVRPAGAPKQAYNHAGTRFDREHLLLLSEMDPVWHDLVREWTAARPIPPTGVPGPTRNAYNAFVNAVNTTNFPTHNPNFWFINGRNAPDTMAEAFAPHLPAQPYNALPRMHPGEKLLLRVINAGRDLHPFHHHGNNTWTIGVDGRMLATSAALGPNLARSDNTLRMIPGQTVDAIYEWTGKGINWDIYGAKCEPNVPPSDATCDRPLEPFQDPADRGKPFPTTLPTPLELSAGDMYSGSPFLGSTGGLPVGAGRLGTGGSYFHMFHSHNEREIINYGIFPGGMMTMIVIEPWTVTID